MRAFGYYPDIAMVEYEGEIYEGKRYGSGVLYDRNGCVVYEGKWVDDDRFTNGTRTRVEISSSLFRFHNCVEELVVQDGCCNDSSWRTLDLRFLFALEVLDVGKMCFQNVDEVRLIGLQKLRRVMIGSNSFTKKERGNDPNRHFCLKNCPKLKSLKIGSLSFSDYSVCEIENVDALKVIEMGDLNGWSYCFYHASLQLTNLLKLESLEFGAGAFKNCSRAVFENLPSLVSILIGENAFAFNDSDKSSTLIMRGTEVEANWNIV